MLANDSVCVAVSVAILAQGTNLLLCFDGILVPALGCYSVFTVGNLSLYLFGRYLRKRLSTQCYPLDFGLSMC